MPETTLSDVIAAHLDEWFALDDVAGIAEGMLDGLPCIKIYLVQANSRTSLELPAEIDGYPVLIEVTGSFGTTDRPAS